jgi:hypothetical protein
MTRSSDYEIHPPHLLSPCGQAGINVYSSQLYPVVYNHFSP